MDKLTSALGLSPTAKRAKNTPELPIFDVISKISDEDRRNLLTKFFSGEMTRPTGCNSAVWSLLSAFGEVLVELAKVPPSNKVQENSSTEALTGGQWTEARNRKRRTSTAVQPTQKVDSLDAVKEAERLRSLVVCHFRESEKSDPIQAENDDDFAIRQLIHKLALNAKIEKWYRMGKRVEDKPRLIKVVLCTSSMQRAVLKNAKNLRDFDEFKRIYIRKSMTPAELVESNKKRAALKWLREKDDRWVIYRNEFWIRDEISGGSRTTVAPQIPDSAYSQKSAQVGSSSNQNQEN